ncbi:MAG TPA: beta-3-deoxy-D-manno-oct-2-ulosonic acid transferase [Noviherbaspirillum sp.]|nr:beta-3-deoxy-D-manno-oct-2-ulosonic acid transferase [Noviherbaspirillum sp.]
MTYQVTGPRAGLPPEVFAYGFSFRKRAIVRRFIGDVNVRFIGDGQSVPPGSALLLWGSGQPPKGTAPDVRIIRLEDGFLRSVGLGADLVFPISWVIDQCGIYYDATCPSELEYLLSTTEFTDDLLKRAAQLRSRVVQSGLTKYNVGSGAWTRPVQAGRVILVPGQVETDASIQFGARRIRTNLGLLQAVRAANPDAYVIYKPHPDVVAGLRRTGAREDEASRWCDEVVVDVSMGEMLRAVDEVHVLTSLAGFEALLRGRQVTCYGQPFYAGWGLTKDMDVIERRTRRLPLDALVAGALILYPVYVSRKTGRFTTPETALDELLAWRESQAIASPSLWSRVLRVVLKIWGGKR